MNKPVSPLILDHDEAFIAELNADASIKLAKPYFAHTGKEAQIIIGNSEIDLAGVFVNLSIPSDDGELSAQSVIRFSKRHRLPVPVYVLCNPGVAKPSDAELKEWGAKACIEKPITYTRMIEMVAPHLSTFDATRGSASKKVDKLGTEVQEQDAEFAPIRARDFVSGSKSFFSVYAKTNAGRYIKLLHAQDIFEAERVESYLKKGVEFFYIRKEDQEQYLKFTQQISSKLVKNENFSIKVQVGQTLNYGQETLNFLSRQGVTENRLAHATNFVGNIQSVISKLAEENDDISALLEDIISYDHGVSVSMITSLIAHHASIESANALKMVGMASLLHDIGLVGAHLGLEYEDVSKMTEEQKTIYYAHPRVSAEMIQKIPGTHAAVVQAIAQHHERVGKKAFDPTQERPKAISGMAEIVGIANDYLDLINKFKTEPASIKPYLEKETYRLFSVDTVEAFNKAFYPSKKPR